MAGVLSSKLARILLYSMRKQGWVAETFHFETFRRFPLQNLTKSALAAKRPQAKTSKELGSVLIAQSVATSKHEVRPYRR
jgi:hypothetical protein